MEPLLQPFRIPSGWTVAYNELHEIDPADVAEDDRYIFLKEDLLQIKQVHFNRLVDVGWLPAGNFADGAYYVDVLEGDWRGKHLYRFHTRDRAELVTEIERLLREVCEARL